MFNSLEDLRKQKEQLIIIGPDSDWNRHIQSQYQEVHHKKARVKSMLITLIFIIVPDVLLQPSIPDKLARIQLQTMKITYYISFTKLKLLLERRPAKGRKMHV
jgi:hypothetical protein